MARRRSRRGVSKRGRRAGNVGKIAMALKSNLVVGRIRQGPAALPPGLKHGGMAHKSCKCKVAKKCMCK
tara:strand:- start:137 stop:343 length:207 start_codon:yes stop_codon:yes gene_type:complete